MEILVGLLAVLILSGWFMRRRGNRSRSNSDPSKHAKFTDTSERPEVKNIRGQRESIWLSAAGADELLGHLSSEDPLPITIESGPGGLLPTSPEGKYLAPGNRHLTRLGLHWLNARGARHFQDERARVMIRPGDHVILKREPKNEYDANAIAIQREGLTLGYVNKGLARRLAKRLDAGDAFRAIALRLEPLSIIISTPERLEHLDL